ncbi:class II SORL domain-containing protein [candidate division WOR-3 bacterium]|nr:class II SORL domain-containing protein [candidate division WOR-3 bacterium]
MSAIGERIQDADWKQEKHVPVIECPDQVQAGEMFEVTVTIGKEVAHPNTTEHHIRWIELFFHPEGGKFPHEVGRYEALAHGESTEGPNEGPLYAHHGVTLKMKTARPGTLLALASCNIHGLWESVKEIKLR